MHYLLDTSNILYRGFYSYKEHPCGEVFYLLSSIRSYLSNKGAHVYLCLDGKPKGRLIDENYKANRVKGDVSVYRYLTYIVSMFRDCNRIHIKYNPELEADEVIYSLTRTLEGNKLIVSSDNDLLQSLKGDTMILRKNVAINEEYYRDEMFSKFHAVDPARLPLYRAIVGDTSDNLTPPVPRFSKELAARIVGDLPYSGDIPTKEEFIKVKDSYEDITKARKDSIERLIENYDKICSNFLIMKLNVHTDIDYSYTEEDLSLADFPIGIKLLYQSILVLDSSIGD